MYNRSNLSEVLSNIIMYRTKHLYLIFETVYQVMTNQYLWDTAASESGRKVYKLKGQQNWCFSWADTNTSRSAFSLRDLCMPNAEWSGGFRNCSYESQDFCYTITVNSTLIPILHLLLKQSKHYLQWNWSWPSIWK